ncbi:helix-turn-helix domain-containing protein [Conexibacter sp. DBS9H8]|uniref:helix-turn-helix domain-containing protein n=1 Tax=Conexibacter sp. DBS9H8 TaxID=2937801 RepID=UPI0020107744|nr:helix-turn-helix domain-containing protein [Conexibacter sp. DBS9H8]
MTGPLENEEFLTVAEVATLLKINEQTVRNWIDRGELSAVRAGRRVRIRRSALDQVLTEVSGARPAATEPVPAGPSGDDFWGGIAVGTADLPVDSNLNR